MGKKLSFMMIVVGVLSLVGIASACRVQDAGQDREPTPPGNPSGVGLVGFEATETLEVGDLFTETPTEEVLAPTETPTPTATWTLFVFTNTPTITATATLFSGPSETPDTFNGQGGFAVTNTPTSQVFVPLGEPSSTSTPTVEQIAFQPSPTNTDLPTNTATNTFTPPTNTPTVTNTLPPTSTPTPSPTATVGTTATFTLYPTFPSLTPTTTAQAIAQAFSPTPNPQQGTAQAILATISAQTLTAAAGSFQGVTPTGQTPFGQTPFAQTPQPFGATPSGFATVFPDCEYLIAPGDKLGNIARTYNVTIEQLIARNPEMIGDGGNLIKAGDTIWIPGCGRNPTATPTGTLTITPAFSGQGGQAAQDNSLGPIEYIVQAGDGIYKLSRVFNVTMAEILRANPQISNINLIIEGQKIIIPTRSQYPTPTPTPTLTLTPSF